MNIRQLRVEFTCPDCDTASQAFISDLETGQYQCPECEAVHHFDKAQATRLRDGIESNLTDLQDALGRIGKRQ